MLEKASSVPKAGTAGRRALGANTAAISAQEAPRKSQQRTTMARLSCQPRERMLRRATAWAVTASDSSAHATSLTGDHMRMKRMPPSLVDAMSVGARCGAVNEPWEGSTQCHVNIACIPAALISRRRPLGSQE